MAKDIKCAYCSKIVGMGRNDAKFCSDKCRVAWSQLSLKMMNKASKAMKLVSEIREMAQKYPHLASLADNYTLDVQQRATQEWMRLSQIEVKS